MNFDDQSIGTSGGGRHSHVGNHVSMASTVTGIDDHWQVSLPMEIRNTRQGQGETV